MNFNELKKCDQSNIINTYARYDVCIESGKGSTCYDVEGKQYVDFSSGIGVNCLGFCDDGYVKATTAQLSTLQHMSNLYYTIPCVKVAETLCKRTHFKKVFFSNSGAEANEGAIKAARKYSFDKYGENRYEIISLQNSFHGRTMATLSATGQESFHKFFNPFLEGFTYAKAGDINELLSKITVKTCAVMLELIQGEGGVIALDKEYVNQVVKICNEKDILVIVDEVQTGMGRTGTLFCYEQFGICPDIITLAKGLGGGLPIGAVLFNDKTQTVFGYGDHGSTFGGNPVSAVGALEILTRIDDEFLAEVKKKSEYIRAKICTFSKVVNVSGIGLMIGITVDGFTSKEVALNALEQGLIVLTAKEKVRLLPPLNITYEEIDKGLGILKNILN